MNVYTVIAQDGYVERDGKQSDPEVLGPWFSRECAEKAKDFVMSLEQSNYTGDGRMPRYESAYVNESKVYESFSQDQCW